MTIPHIPALRRGRAYESLDRSKHRRLAAPAKSWPRSARLNAGIIRKDLARITDARAALKNLPIARLLEICAQAGAQFLEGTLPLGGGDAIAASILGITFRQQRPAHVMVRRNMGQNPRGPDQHAGHFERSDARAGLVGFGQRAWPAPLLLSGFAESRAGHAEQFTRAVNSLWLPASR